MVAQAAESVLIIVGQLAFIHLGSHKVRTAGSETSLTALGSETVISRFLGCYYTQLHNRNNTIEIPVEVLILCSSCAVSSPLQLSDSLLSLPINQDPVAKRV